MTGDFSKKDSLNTVFKEESRIQNDKTNVKETLSKTAVEILPISPRQANLKSKLNPDEIDSVCLKVSMKSYRMVQTPENTIETKIPNYDPSEVCYEKVFSIGLFFFTKYFSSFKCSKCLKYHIRVFLIATQKTNS